MPSNVNARVYGPIVGENYSNAMIGAYDNRLTPNDVALSPDLLRQFPLRTPIQYNGHTYNVGDTSYVSPGQPNTNTIEFRDNPNPPDQVTFSAGGPQTAMGGTGRTNNLGFYSSPDDVLDGKVAGVLGHLPMVGPALKIANLLWKTGGSIGNSFNGDPASAPGGPIDANAIAHIDNNIPVGNLSDRPFPGNPGPFTPAPTMLQNIWSADRPVRPGAPAPSPYAWSMNNGAQGPTRTLADGRVVPIADSVGAPQSPGDVSMGGSEGGEIEGRGGRFSGTRTIPQTAGGRRPVAVK